MTSPEDGLEQALRRALRATADQVEPGADGLERIRARTRGRQPQPWLVSVAAGAFGYARHWTWRGHWVWPESLPRPGDLPRFGLRLLPAAITHAPPPRHAATPAKSSWPTGVGWLRPVGVLASIAFIASIALAVPPFRQAIVQVSSTVLTGGPTAGQPGGGGGGAPAGSGQPSGAKSPAGAGATATQSSSTAPGGVITAHCTPSARPA